MKFIFQIFIFLCIFKIPQSRAAPDLTVFAYESLLGPKSLGQKIVSGFEQKCKCALKVIDVGDSGQLINRLQLAKLQKSPLPQIILGLDQYQWQALRSQADVDALSLKWKGYQSLPEEWKWSDPGFVPFDFGVLALMANLDLLERRKIPVPHSLSDLAKPIFYKSFLLEDPRVSTPGAIFVYLTQEIFKKDFDQNWKKLQKNWMTLAPGWSSAYSLFVQKQAPLVWSYTTSQAYHEENRKKGDPNFRALVFDDGNPIQIEGAMILKAGITTQKQLQLAIEFMDFLLQPEVQSHVALTNWMFPVVESTQLPKSFNSIPKPKKILNLNRSELQVKDALQAWSKAISGP